LVPTKSNSYYQAFKVKSLFGEIDCPKISQVKLKGQIKSCLFPHPIIILSDSNIEDTFSSTHSPDYISTSPDYFPASPGNISPDSSNDLTKYLLTSLAISPYHNDLYIIQAYDDIPPPQAIIALPAVLPISLVLSLPPMFDSRDFFSPEKISPPKDTETPIKSPIQVYPSSSVGSSSPVRSTTSPPNYPFDELSKWLASRQDRGIAWTELKRLLTNKYCPRTEVKKMEDELYNLVVKGNDLKTYIRRFQELETLCPNMVPNTENLLEAFIGGLPRRIEGNVTASKPQTLEEAINIAQRLMDPNRRQEAVKAYAATPAKNNIVTTALEAQAATMEDTSNPNMNTDPTGLL
nr:reverse transcriptase domain-containing protein [Tanacetum cinerariifolium]